MTALGTYERTPSGVRYVHPAGSRGIDRVPAHLRDLAPTAVRPLAMTVFDRAAQDAHQRGEGGRVLVHRVDPQWQPKVGITARAMHRMNARRVAEVIAERRASTRPEPKAISPDELAKRSEKAQADAARRDRLTYRREVAAEAGFTSIGRAVRAGVLPR